VTPRPERSLSSSRLLNGSRRPTSNWPDLRDFVRAASGNLTTAITVHFAMICLRVASVAPACLYAASSNVAPPPAPLSTKTSRPDFVKRSTAVGSKATRCSPSAVSASTPTINGGVWSIDFWGVAALGAAPFTAFAVAGVVMESSAICGYIRRGVQSDCLQASFETPRRTQDSPATPRFQNEGHWSLFPGLSRPGPPSELFVSKNGAEGPYLRPNRGDRLELEAAPLQKKDS